MLTSFNHDRSNRREGKGREGEGKKRGGRESYSILNNQFMKVEGQWPPNLNLTFVSCFLCLCHFRNIFDILTGRVI